MNCCNCTIWQTHRYGSYTPTSSPSQSKAAYLVCDCLYLLRTEHLAHRLLLVGSSTYFSALHSFVHCFYALVEVGRCIFFLDYISLKLCISARGLFRNRAILAMWLTTVVMFSVSTVHYVLSCVFLNAALETDQLNIDVYIEDYAGRSDQSRDSPKYLTLMNRLLVAFLCLPNINVSVDYIFVTSASFYLFLG